MSTKRKRTHILGIKIWSSVWDVTLENKEPLNESPEHGIELPVIFDAQLLNVVYDRKEDLLNTKHQEITQLPHEIRGFYVKNLKGRGFMKKTSISALKPVDIERECSQTLADYYHQIPQLSWG